jgi:hypothetical protein
LFRCADYLKHLAKATKEKEELVNKAKTELEMTERKLEEEKANVERSDPESVASSLRERTGGKVIANGSPSQTRLSKLRK